MASNHIRGGMIRIKQTSKKTDFTIDLLAMVVLAKACPNNCISAFMYKVCKEDYCSPVV